MTAATLAACGLVPAPGPPAPFPGDGVAGFGDSTPIELCIGSAHVVSPSVATGAGAVCVGAGASPTACSSDAVCMGIERCVCGRCIVQGCFGGAGCAAGMVCTDQRCTTECQVDADCPTGEQCNVGGCTRPCTSDASCHYGERCDGLANVCVTKICSATTPCAPGDACEGETVAGGMHEPEIATFGAASVAYVEVRAGAAGTGAIFRARIDAPGRWTADPVTPVLATAQGLATGAPSVLVDGDRVDMYFALGDGAGIAHAASTDAGRTFTPDATPTLVPAASWQNAWIGSPSVVRFQGATLLFYEGGPGAGVGLARLGAQGTLRASGAPIVTPAMIADPVLWREVTQVGTPYAVVAGEVLRVFVTGRGIFGSDADQGDAAIAADVTDAIGMVASEDAITFTPYPTGPVYDRITNLREYLGAREPVVQLLPGGGASITFVATDATGAIESGLASASQ
jgi:hypothetical protein